MNIAAAFLCTASAAWHGVNAYYFCFKPGPFVRTYRLTDERSESLAADVLSWHGGLHAVMAMYSFFSSLRVMTLSKLDIQIPLLLGAATLSQTILVRPEERWRPELKWLTIINSALCLAHLSLAFFIFRGPSKNLVIDVLAGVQKFINK